MDRGVAFVKVESSKVLLLIQERAEMLYELGWTPREA
jgi:hypothetical protein